METKNPVLKHKPLGFFQKKKKKKWPSSTEALIEGHYFNKCVSTESIILTGLKTLAPWKESYEKSRQCIKNQRHHFANKGLYSQSYGFSSNHVPVWQGVGDIVTIWCPTLATPWTVACQAQLFMGFPRQEYWSGFPFPSPGDWTIKKAEHWRIDAFELWCWERLWRVPWTARRSNKLILKGNKPWIWIGRTDAEIEAPIHGPPDAKCWLIGNDPEAGKDWR